MGTFQDPKSAKYRYIPGNQRGKSSNLPEVRIVKMSCANGAKASQQTTSVAPLDPGLVQTVGCIDFVLKHCLENTEVGYLGLRFRIFASGFTFDGKPLQTGSSELTEKIRIQLADRALDPIIEFMTFVGLIGTKKRYYLTKGDWLGLQEIDVVSVTRHGRTYLRLPRVFRMSYIWLVIQLIVWYGILKRFRAIFAMASTISLVIGWYIHSNITVFLFVAAMLLGVVAARLSMWFSDGFH